jgi:hypothetical protein
MVGAGVPRLVVSKILNHVETGVTAVYDRHSYDQEKRSALDFWGKTPGSNHREQARRESADVRGRSADSSDSDRYTPASGH